MVYSTELGATLVDSSAGFPLQLGPSGLPAHLTPSGTFLDAAGATQMTFCPASPGSPVQPVPTLRVGDQLLQGIPVPRLHSLPGASVVHVSGPLPPGDLEASSYQVENGAFPHVQAGMTSLSGYRENSSAEPVVFVPEYQQHQHQLHQYQEPQYQRHQYQKPQYQRHQHQEPQYHQQLQQEQWHSQARILAHNLGLFPPDMRLSDLPSQPVNFADDHAADIDHRANVQYTTGTLSTQAGITDAHHSTVVHEGAPCSSALPEGSIRVPQPPTASAPAQQGAEDSDDDQAVVVIEDRSTLGRTRLHFLPKQVAQRSRPTSRAAHIGQLDASINCKPQQKVEPVTPVKASSSTSRAANIGQLDASINRRPQQNVEPVKPVKASYPTRFGENYPVAGPSCDAGAVSGCFSSVVRGPAGVAATGECVRDLYGAEEIPDDILASFSMGAPSFLQTLTADSVAEELERIDNPNIKSSCDMQRDVRGLPASYYNPDSPALSPPDTHQRVPNASCATTWLGVVSSPPGICDADRKKAAAKEDEIEVTFDSTDARFRKRSTSSAQDERVSRKLMEMLSPPDLAEFDADMALYADSMNHLADLTPLVSSRDILTSDSPPSRAMWGTEDVIKIMSSPSEGEHERAGGVVAQSTACPEEQEPLASRDILTSRSPPSRAMWEMEDVIKVTPNPSESEHERAGVVVARSTACPEEEKPLASRDILTSRSPPSRAMWEMEDVIKVTPNPYESEYERAGGVVGQSTACPDEEKPLASIPSPTTTGNKSAKKRKSSELHEVLPDSPLESDSSEPKCQKCCCREGALGDIKKTHNGPSTCDLVTMPWAVFFDRRDAHYKRGKYAKKRRKKKKSIWA